MFTHNYYVAALALHSAPETIRAEKSDIIIPQYVIDFCKFNRYARADIEKTLRANPVADFEKLVNNYKSLLNMRVKSAPVDIAAENYKAKTAAALPRYTPSAAADIETTRRRKIAIPQRAPRVPLKDYPTIPAISETWYNVKDLKPRKITYIIPSSAVWCDYCITVNAVKVVLTIVKTKYNRMSANGTVVDKIVKRLSVIGAAYSKLCRYYADNINNTAISEIDINRRAEDIICGMYDIGDNSSKLSGGISVDDTELYEMYSTAIVAIISYSAWDMYSAMQYAYSAVNKYLHSEIKDTANTARDITAAEYDIGIYDIAQFDAWQKSQIDDITARRYAAERAADNDDVRVLISRAAAKINYILSAPQCEFTYFTREKGIEKQHIARITAENAEIFRRYADIMNSTKGGTAAAGLGAVAEYFGYTRAKVQRAVEKVRAVILYNAFNLRTMPSDKYIDFSKFAVYAG